MYLMARPPNMMPTQILTGVNASGQTVSRKRNYISLDIFKRSAASPRMSLSKEMGILGGLLGLTGGVFGLGLGML